MNPIARQKVIELVERFGSDICDDPRRCEALLRDLCGDQHQREVFVLVAAVRNRTAAELAAGGGGVPKEVLLARLSARLHNNLGFAQDLARWSIESWAFALGTLTLLQLAHKHGRLTCDDVNNSLPHPLPPEDIDHLCERLRSRDIKIVDSAKEAAEQGDADTYDIAHKLLAGGSITVECAVNEWEQWLRNSCGSDRTVDNYAIFGRAWMRDTKSADKKIITIKEDDSSNWINLQDGTKLASKRVKLAAVRSLFTFCSRCQYVSRDPSRVLVKAQFLSHDQKEPRRKTSFTDWEIQIILTYLSDRMLELDLADNRSAATEHKLQVARFWYCATLIGRHAGLRLGDICCLERASLNAV